jgi:hypothetical protein
VSAQHTPAPWTLSTVPTSAGICHKIGPFPWKHGEQNHACIYGDYSSHDGSGPFEAELLANARLIKAAPTLLAALQGMLFDDDQDEARRNAVAALVSATGSEA